MLGFYDYTVILTYLSVVSSVVGLFLATKEMFLGAVICLLLSGLCDMFDGMVARTKKNRTEMEKKNGIQLDSLADVVCFGVLPAAIGFSIGADKVWQIIILVLFALCGLIRLAYFNVTEETRQQQTETKRKSYEGVPITSSALTVPLLFCFRKLIGAAFPIAYTVLLLVNGAAFVTPVKVKKPGKKGVIIMLALGVVFTILIIVL